MKVFYQYKYRNQTFHQELHPWHEAVIQKCLSDFRECGIYDGEIQIIFQTAPSVRRDRWYGRCFYNHFGSNRHLIYLYTYRHWTRTIGKTIAHEFGHIRHFVTKPESHYWIKREREAYANWYESIIYSSLG